MGQSTAQKQKAKALTQQKKVKDAAKAVKAAREAAKDLEVTSLDEWLTPAVQEGTKIKLPSGKVCLAKNPGMDVFFEQGMIPNRLMPIVRAAIAEGRGLPPKQVEEIAEDPEALSDILLFANRVTVHSVIQPEVKMPPVWTDEDRAAGECREEQVGGVAESKRKPGVLYADMIDLDDRLFLLQWCVGGTKDLERFRGQQADAVAAVDAGEEQSVQAE